MGDTGLNATGDTGRDAMGDTGLNAMSDRRYSVFPGDRPARCPSGGGTSAR